MALLGDTRALIAPFVLSTLTHTLQPFSRLLFAGLGDVGVFRCAAIVSIPYVNKQEKGTAGETYALNPRATFSSRRSSSEDSGFSSSLFSSCRACSLALSETFLLEIELEGLVMEIFRRGKLYSRPVAALDVFLAHFGSCR